MVLKWFFRDHLFFLVKDDITECDVDAIVNPANSLMIMGGGVAGAIKRRGGAGIEREAVQMAPVKVGDAVVTSAGKLKARFVIHAPTMAYPTMRIGVGNIRLAVRAALKVAGEKGFRSIAFPGMGTGVGGVDQVVAAEAMVEEIIKWFEISGETDVYLVAFNDALFNAFKKALEKRIPSLA